MDRETLVLRNRAMTEAYHTPPPKHFIRRLLLRAAARLPVSSSRPPDVERILLMRPDHLGDVLLTMPAFHALRRARTGAELHALVGPWSAAVLATNPDVDVALTLDFPGFNRAGNENLRSPYDLAIRTARQLRQVGYSHAVILRPDHWWGAMVAFLAGIPVRIGYDVGDVSPFLTDRIAFDRQHAVMQNIKLLSRWVGAVDEADVVYRYAINDADRADIKAYLARHELDADGARYFCIHAGSGTTVKQWTAANWAIVADTLAEQLDAVPVFTGGDHERGLVADITAAMQSRHVVAVGDTDIGGLAALFERALVVLGTDSGPLHLASAVAVPTVALFGPADPVEFGQWGDTARHIILTTDIACRPCRVLDWAGDDLAYHPCVREISVGRVLEAARRVVAGDPPIRV